MALDNFRTIELIWDKANKSIIKTIKTASSDTTGRYLSVKILDGGQEVDLTGAKLQLYWEHPNFNTRGTDNFAAVDNKGLFKLTFSDEMLTNIGELNAHLVLTLSDGKITSDGFAIVVFKGADDGVVVPTNSDGLIKQIDIKIDKIISDLNNISVSQINKNLGKFDSTYFSDEFLNDLAGGTIDATNVVNESITNGKLATKSVTPHKTSFISNTNNLHNYKTDTPLKTLDGATGGLLNSSNNNTSDNKEVKPSTLYSIKYIATMVEFDANFNFIRNTFYDATQRLQKQSFTTQANTKIVRYSYPKEFANRVIFSEGDSLVDVEAGYLLPFFKTQDYVDKSINLDKHVSNLEVTNNLVNLGTELKGKSFNLTTGAMIENTSTNIVEKYRVKPETSYFVRGVTNVLFYDITGAYISNWFIPKATRYSTGLIKSSPDTAYTASVIFANDIAKSYIQMSESTKVEPLIYNQLIDKNRNYGVSKSRLFGKTLMSFGDSIAQSLGEFGYDDMIAAKYHMSLLKHGRGGATIGKITSDSANHTVQEQIDKAIADGETADYIIFNGGTNDYGTIGSITSGYTSTLNLETFCGAFENVIRTLRNAYPRAKIVYTSAHKMSTRGVPEKGELYLLAYDICKKYGIPYADIFFESQMDTNFDNMKLIYGRKEGADGTHPNTLAYEEHYVPIIESKLESI